jgi:parallel beta-helix repeat protein
MHFKPLISIPISGAVFLIMLAFSLSAFAQSAQAADYYVDCSASSNGNGTFGSPWNNLPSVNAKTFATGDDVYFKVGTTCYLNSDSDRLQVDWSGTGSNRVIIGAYHGNGMFGLGGFERPIIDGNSRQYPAGDYLGVVEVLNRSYVTIKDLKIQNAAGRGIRVKDASYINVENNYIYNNTQIGIGYTVVNTGNIIDNTINQSKRMSGTGVGAALEVSGGNVTGGTKNIYIARNYVFMSKHEGIGLYKKVENSIVEYNIIRDTASYMLYSDASSNNTYRYNLLYVTTDNALSRKNAMTCNLESFHDYCWGGGNKFYGNFIGGAGRGMSFGNGKQAAGCRPHKNNKVYNNTFVDCNYTFTFWSPTAEENIDVANNISIITSENSTGRHIYSATGGNSPPGVTWSHNLFRGGTLPTGNAATNMITGDPKLTKTSGWRTIAPNSLTANHFKLLSTSAAIDKGTALVSPYNVDYFKTPRPQGGAWDIGAHEFTTGAVTPVPNPTPTPTPTGCQKLTSSSVLPANYGSPYNMAINRQELLINTNCQSNSVQLNIGNNSPNQYIWSKAYVWRNNAWQIINLNGSTPAYNNLWFKGSANASVNLTSQEISQENKIVAFVCNWHNNSWKCGCRDSACGQMFWQLQVFGNY